ncbi:MAG: dihydroorotate dehydrogenase electron transfer subunit [Acidobacteria bacterium]|jgi:dihydroorotate dehydrogenase electron transfer subunit|nr:dihydroorotate dehydrogenase electron transfer subunit [Acidobacteriota bacterium]MDP7479791.1 dihydroorotate dehydrogenase electron transfer subunit [Vicinamibacterales bacterium]MDP7691261.1 dihydroorotate dehydrogenase electron transfer subunit [Vicinamibacterales bacterium]HJN45602.1 dihydroorotate dehydrogenase electron transfer subunit [Vicinamibacterales bacterium]|tara:strand:+ start:6255 stop:7076 length:822 start_codon:yes stop_codon:yes gene_type:complete
MPVDVDAVVVSNSQLTNDYNVLSLTAPALASQAQPGQFVMVKAGTGDNPLLRRPFSVFEVQRDDARHVTGFSLLNKRIGVTTRILFALKPGDRVRCLGPLGRPFSVAEPPERAWMVAGGVGLAPFATLAAALRQRDVETTLFYGGQRASDLFHLDEFRQLGVSLELSTDDGSRGHHGNVTVPLAHALEATNRAEPVRVYACGPTPMMRAVTELTASHGRATEVSLEQVMGCGLGGCYSCVVPIRRDRGPAHFVRSCVDGPVFDGRTVVWEQLG